MDKFSFGGEWGVLDDEFDFGCVEFGLMRPCVLLSGRLVVGLFV